MLKGTGIKILAVLLFVAFGCTASCFAQSPDTLSGVASRPVADNTPPPDENVPEEPQHAEGVHLDGNIPPDVNVQPAPSVADALPDHAPYAIRVADSEFDPVALDEADVPGPPPRTMSRKERRLARKAAKEQLPVAEPPRSFRVTSGKKIDEQADTSAESLLAAQLRRDSLAGLKLDSLARLQLDSLSKAHAAIINALPPADDLFGPLARANGVARADSLLRLHGVDTDAVLTAYSARRGAGSGNAGRDSLESAGNDNTAGGSLAGTDAGSQPTTSATPPDSDRPDMDPELQGADDVLPNTEPESLNGDGRDTGLQPQGTADVPPATEQDSLQSGQQETVQEPQSAEDLLSGAEPDLSQGEETDPQSQGTADVLPTDGGSGSLHGDRQPTEPQVSEDVPPISPSNPPVSEDIRREALRSAYTLMRDSIIMVMGRELDETAKLLAETVTDTLTRREQRRLQRQLERADTTLYRHNRFFRDTLPFNRFTLLSVIPGFGQFYNGDYWKIPVFYGAVGTAAYFAVQQNKKFQHYKRIYDYRNSGDFPREMIDPVRNNMIIHNTARQVLFGAAYAGYVYMIGDAMINYPSAAHRVQTATWLSTFCPGAGQIYNKSYWRVPWALGGFSAFLYVVDYNNRVYQRYMTNLAKNPNDSNARTSKDNARRARDLAYILTGAWYLFNVMDAHVDAQLKDFDISDDLAWRLEPMADYFYTPMTGNVSVIGLSLSYNF